MCDKIHSYYREEVQEFFDKMDRDFDGRLSFGEFMGEETPLEKVFKNMDKDGDGWITKDVTVYISNFLINKCIFRNIYNFANTSLQNRYRNSQQKHYSVWL